LGFGSWNVEGASARATLGKTASGFISRKMLKLKLKFALLMFQDVHPGIFTTLIGSPPTLSSQNKGVNDFMLGMACLD